MTELIAKTVLKNKYWIVESDGDKIGTIQAADDGSVVFVHDLQREKFASIKLLTKSKNLVIVKGVVTKKNQVKNEVYGFPTICKPYNQLWDVKNKLPVFTKANKSKSYFCAGFYLIKFKDIWEISFCPKLIAVNRYSFSGPFATKEQATTELEKMHGN